MYNKEQEANNLIEHRAEEATSLTIEHKEVATPTPSNFSAQVYIDPGKKPLIETPENKEVTIAIPKPILTLQEDAKGSIDDSRTWWSKFFLRIAAKAGILKQRVVVKR